MVLHGFRAPRGKVLDQGPASDAQFSGFHGSMKVLSAEKMAIHSLHQTIQHVAGPMGVWVMVRRAIVNHILT